MIENHSKMPIMASKPSKQLPKQGHRQRTGKATASKFSGIFLQNTFKRYEKDCGRGSTPPHATPLLKIVQRLMTHPVDGTKAEHFFTSIGHAN